MVFLQVTGSDIVYFSSGKVPDFQYIYDTRNKQYPGSDNISQYAEYPLLYALRSPRMRHFLPCMAISGIQEADCWKEDSCKKQQ